VATSGQARNRCHVTTDESKFQMTALAKRAAEDYSDDGQLYLVL